MAGLRHSRQREAILTYLHSTKTHPTAEIVYEYMRKEYPQISLGTIYRNLNLLVSLGEAIKVDCGDGFDHFDGNPSMHYHFICHCCKSIIDLEMKLLDHINTLAAASFNGTIDGHKVYFYGICPKCYNKNKNDC